jgi:hypothetical protein
MDTGKLDKKDSKRTKNEAKIDLMNRYKDVKRKIDTIRHQRIHEELKENQGAPKINSISKKLAKSIKEVIYSPSRMQRTYEILKNSRFMPKKVKISLDTLKPGSGHSKSRVKKFTRYAMAITTPRVQSPVTSPSLVNPEKLRGSNSISEFPSDITARNELLFSFKSQTSPKGFETKVKEPSTKSLPFQQRTQKWLQKKQEKITKLKESKENSSVNGCTFKPYLQSKKTQSTYSSQRTLSSDNSYNIFYNVKKNQFKPKTLSGSKTERTRSYESRADSSDNIGRIKDGSHFRSLSSIYTGLCPVAVSIVYPTGYPSDFKKKAKPMIGYRSLTLSSRY